MLTGNQLKIKRINSNIIFINNPIKNSKFCDFKYFYNASNLIK